MHQDTGYGLLQESSENYIYQKACDIWNLGEVSCVNDGEEALWMHYDVPFENQGVWRGEEESLPPPPLNYELAGIEYPTPEFQIVAICGPQCVCVCGGGTFISHTPPLNLNF